MHHVDAMEQLTSKLGKFKSNEEFLMLIQGANTLD
jgi:transcription termination factor Rho